MKDSGATATVNKAKEVVRVIRDHFALRSALRFVQEADGQQPLSEVTFSTKRWGSVDDLIERLLAL